ncbi:MAG: LAGLIDADG family homing endonuclease [Thermoleophilia bacterium]
MTGADNQQERLGCYIAGYVDGEGSFHVSIQKSSYVLVGYQLIPEFRVSQNTERNSVLEIIQETIQCGYIKQNHPGNDKDKASVLVVRNRKDLIAKVIPFFETYQIISAKADEFRKFAVIVKAMSQGKHLQRDGFIELLGIAFSMNGNGRYRRLSYGEIVSNLESSETIRRTRSWQRS